MRRIRGNGPNVVIEIKRVSSGHADAGELASKALRQIREKKYAYGLEGRTILYGAAFDNKDPVIVSETVTY